MYLYAPCRPWKPVLWIRISASMSQIHNTAEKWNPTICPNSYQCRPPNFSTNNTLKPIRMWHAKKCTKKFKWNLNSLPPECLWGRAQKHRLNKTRDLPLCQAVRVVVDEVQGPGAALHLHEASLHTKIHNYQIIRYLLLLTPHIWGNGIKSKKVSR